MPIYTTGLNIDRAAVIRGLGYRDTDDINPQTLNEIAEEIAAVRSVLTPKAVYAQYPLRIDAVTQRLFLPTGFFTPGRCIFERLHQADNLIIVVATVGDTTVAAQSPAVDNDDLFTLFLRDTIGTVALYELQHNFWQEQIRFAAKKQLGVTGLFCPGDGEWDIKDQDILFANINAASIGVTINRKYVMKPVKSFSMVYGTGANISTPLREHVCNDCSRTLCPHRRIDI